MGRVISLTDEQKIIVQNKDVEAAASRGISLSKYLNETYAKKVVEVNKMYNSELDAFDIALLSHGIITRDNYEFGIESSNLFTFFNGATTNNNRNLFPEFMIRTLRQISGMPSIINDIVASTRTIQGDAAKQVVLDLTDTSTVGKENKKALRKRRVAEGSNIPVATLKLGEVAIRIYKYGIGVKATYEVMRRTTIDMFRKQIELISLQAAYDQVSEVIDIIINGDGNTNPAKLYKASKLNTNAVEGKLDEITLIKFLVKQAPINFDTIIVDEEIYTQICTILMDKNLTNQINPQVAFTFPQGLLSNLKVIYSEDLGKTSDGKHQIIGLSKAYAIEKTVEAGSMINEIVRTAENQTQTAYITENAGFNKIDSRASAILVLDGKADRE